MLAVVDGWIVGVFDRGRGAGLVLIRPVAIGTFVVVDDEVGLALGGFVTSGLIQDGLGFVVGGRSVNSGGHKGGLGVIAGGPFVTFVRIQGGADSVVDVFITFLSIQAGIGVIVGELLVILVRFNGRIGFGVLVRFGGEVHRRTASHCRRRLQRHPSLSSTIALSRKRKRSVDIFPLPYSRLFLLRGERRAP